MLKIYQTVYLQHFSSAIWIWIHTLPARDWFQTHPSPDLCYGIFFQEFIKVGIIEVIFF